MEFVWQSERDDSPYRGFATWHFADYLDKKAHSFEGSSFDNERSERFSIRGRRAGEFQQKAQSSGLPPPQVFSEDDKWAMVKDYLATQEARLRLSQTT